MTHASLTIEQVREIFKRDVLDQWIDEGRHGNDGSAGNTLEDLLGVTENNLQIPDWGQFELKTHKKEGGSLLTLLHREPRPDASVPKLLRALGWRHRRAGTDYPQNEMSFRSTTYALRPSVRGFQVRLDKAGERVEFEYDPNNVARGEPDPTGAYPTYGDWADDLESRQPHFREVLPVYWELDDLGRALVEKLDHTILAFYSTKGSKASGRKFKFSDPVLMRGFRIDKIDELLHDHALVIDFDARTGHNHGTKVRVDVTRLADLFDEYERLN